MDSQEHSVHPNMRVVWMIRNVFWGLVLVAVVAGGLATAARVTDRTAPWTLFGIGALVWLVLQAWLAVLAWRHWRWRVTDQALVISHGVLLRQRMILPLVRIQNIDTTRGPLDQLLGMAQLQIHSASESASIPGIDHERAAGLRQDVLTHAQRAADLLGMDRAIDAV